MQVPEQRAVLADRLLATPALDKSRQVEQMLAVPPQNPPQGHLVRAARARIRRELIQPVARDDRCLGAAHEAHAAVALGKTFRNTLYNIDDGRAAPTTRRSSNKPTAACRT